MFGWAVPLGSSLGRVSGASGRSPAAEMAPSFDYCMRRSHSDVGVRVIRLVLQYTRGQKAAPGFRA